MKSTRVHTSRAEQLFFHSQPIKFLSYGIVVVVPFVDAKTL